MILQRLPACTEVRAGNIAFGVGESVTKRHADEEQSLLRFSTGKQMCADGINVRSIGPVSYTHLTLPTIYSV